MEAKNSKSARTVAALIYALGVLLGMAFLALSVWGDLEATLFESWLRADTPISTLSCPVMITRDEVGVISITVDNSLDREITVLVRTHISDGFLTLIREIDTRPTILAGEAETLTYEIEADDAVWGLFVLNRVYVASAYPVPSRGAMCGVLVAPIAGLTGNQLVATILALSFLAMAVGLFLWARSHRPLVGRSQEMTYAMVVLMAALVVGTLISLPGQWMLALLFGVVAIFMVVTLLGNYFIGS